MIMAAPAKPGGRARRDGAVVPDQARLTTCRTGRDGRVAPRRPVGAVTSGALGPRGYMIA